MNYYTQKIIKEQPNALRYLRENSAWYKILNRDGFAVKQMIDEMKERYSLRPSDKINNIIDSMEIISSFIDNTK